MMPVNNKINCAYSITSVKLRLIIDKAIPYAAKPTRDKFLSVISFETTLEPIIIPIARNNVNCAISDAVLSLSTTGAHPTNITRRVAATAQNNAPLKITKQAKGCIKKCIICLKNSLNEGRTSVK